MNFFVVLIVESSTATEADEGFHKENEINGENSTLHLPE